MLLTGRLIKVECDINAWIKPKYSARSAINTNSLSVPNSAAFQTTTALFQLRLGPISDCGDWVVSVMNTYNGLDTPLSNYLYPAHRGTADSKKFLTSLIK